MAYELIYAMHTTINYIIMILNCLHYVGNFCIQESENDSNTEKGKFMGMFIVKNLLIKNVKINNNFKNINL